MTEADKKLVIRRGSDGGGIQGKDCLLWRTFLVAL